MNDYVRAAGQVTDSDLYNLAVYADTFRHHEHMEFNTAMIARVVAELKQRRDATPPDAAGPDLGRLLPDCLWAVETLKNLATRAAVKGFDLGGDAGEGIVKLAHLEHELRFLARRGRDAERELAELRERVTKLEAAAAAALLNGTHPETCEWWDEKCEAGLFHFKGVCDCYLSDIAALVSAPEVTTP